MTRELTITKSAIDEGSLTRSRAHSITSGAVITFLGVVRGTEQGAVISSIEYEAFESMARHQFEKIFDAVEKRWPIESIRLIHRVGVVLAGDVSLWVELCAPHRGEAFAACQFVIEEMKRVVPIWKKPLTAN